MTKREELAALRGDKITALCIWPGHGSVWLHEAYYEPNEEYGRIIQGVVYEDLSGFHIDRLPMWFPQSCVLREAPNDQA